jgi:hypothetical protein
LMFSTPSMETTAEAVAVVFRMFKVSVPAPPMMLSPIVKVAVVACKAVIVSLPAPPWIVSTLVVSVQFNALQRIEIIGIFIHEYVSTSSQRQI